MSLMGLVFLSLLLGAAVLLPAGAEVLQGKRARKWAAAVILPLLALPVGAAAVNGAVLDPLGLTLRGRVWAGCGLLFTAGALGALACLEAFLRWCVRGWKPLARGTARCLFWGAASLLCAFVGTFGLIASLFFGADDATVEWNGALAVRESYGLSDGYDYYACHGPFLRGTEMLEGSGRLEMRAQWERKWAEDAALLRKVGRMLGLDLSRGNVWASFDTHGGFHNDGETYVKITFSYTDIMPEQLEDNPDWLPLPMPEGLYELAGRLPDAPPPLPAEQLDAGWYRFVDLHSEAADRGDWSAAAARKSYNFILAVYDYGEAELTFYRLDT